MMTPAQHQRMLDDSAEVESLAENLKADATEKLRDMRPILYRKRNGFGQIMVDTKTSFDMWEAMHSLKDMRITQAVAWVGTDMEKMAIQQFIEARDAAVEHVIAGIDFEQWAECEIELSEREVA